MFKRVEGLGLRFEGTWGLGNLEVAQEVYRNRGERVPCDQQNRSPRRLWGIIQGLERGYYGCI